MTDVSWASLRAEERRQTVFELGLFDALYASAWSCSWLDESMVDALFVHAYARWGDALFDGAGPAWLHRVEQCRALISSRLIPRIPPSHVSNRRARKTRNKP